jgi:hypothetical protein
MNRYRRAAFALFVVLFCLPRGVGAQSVALSHVTVDATILCTNIDVTTARIALSLDDAIVSGREYYPDTKVEHLGANRLRITFDAPGGVFGLDARVLDVEGNYAGNCSFNERLMTLPGVPKTLAFTVKSSIFSLWDQTDFIAGSVAGGASVMPFDLPRSAPCGTVWKRDPREDEPPQSGHYYSQLGFSPSTTRPALVVDDGGHIAVVALDPIVHTPLVDSAYIRRDVSTADLARWKALPSMTIVCESGDRRYGTASAAPTANLQPVDITTIIDCSLRNDLYSKERPEVEVEDQLHRGTFFYPPVYVLGHSGNVLHLRMDVPPGAYELGMRLPRVPAAGIGCYSATRFIVLPHAPRHLTFTICSCGNGSNYRAFVAVRLAAPSIRVGVTMMPSSIRCGADYPNGFEPGQDVDYAVADGGVYYAAYDPYDPSKQPALVIDGPGIARIFVSLPGSGSDAQPMESLHVVDVSVRTLSRWLAVQNQRRLICN